jgi:anti-anti-sigma factor
MVEVSQGFRLEVERGPDWLFVRFAEFPDSPHELPPVAETVWRLLEQHFIHRVVLECQNIHHLHSTLLGELVRLYKRVSTHGGVLRLCGLSPENESVLAICRLDQCFPNYSDRVAAVRGERPRQPR